MKSLKTLLLKFIPPQDLSLARDRAYVVLEQTGHRVIRAALPGGRLLTVVLPPGSAVADSAENDNLWAAIGESLDQIVAAIKATHRLPFTSGASPEARRAH